MDAFLFVVELGSPVAGAEWRGADGRAAIDSGLFGGGCGGGGGGEGGGEFATVHCGDPVAMVVQLGVARMVGLIGTSATLEHGLFQKRIGAGKRWLLPEEFKEADEIGLTRSVCSDEHVQPVP